MNILKKVLSFLFVIPLLIAGFLFLSDVMVSPPTKLIILVDHIHKEIVSPECLSPTITSIPEGLEVTTLDIAHQLDYKYDSICTEESLYPSRNSFWNFIGTKLGLIKPLGWKWNDDGTWNEEVFN